MTKLTDIKKAGDLVSDARNKADDAFRLLEKYMTKDERLIHDGVDIADELRGAIVTLAGAETGLSEMEDEEELKG